MGRIRRSHLPGTAFHLTARTQGREAWFTPLVRTRIVEYVRATVSRCDAILLAYAIMPNHLHLVIRQGRQPLWRLMQPLLRRTALLVQRTHGLAGHVFERRYADRACNDPEHARNAIVYTHLNPVRAGIVQDPADYPWTSHASYCAVRQRSPAPTTVLRSDLGLRLFASHAHSSRAGLHSCYGRHVEWRRACDRLRAAPDAPPTLLPPPRAAGGDVAWRVLFGPILREPAEREPAAAELQAIARQVLLEEARDLPLEAVRSPYKGRRVVRVRRIMIHRMSAAGHRGAAIARYLGVSDQCVSMVLRSKR